MSTLVTTPIVEQANPNVTDNAAVAERISSFQVFRNQVLREVFRLFPAMLGVLLAIDWLVFQGQLVLTNLPRLTSSVSFAIGVLLYLRLYGKVPESLKTLWDRHVLVGRDDQTLSTESYIRYLDDFEGALNSRRGVVFGVLVLLVAAILLFREPAVSAADTLIGVIILLALASLSWFLAGIGFWRLVVITLRLRELNQRFKIKVQPAHPDKSGGLQPLGDLCLAMALTVLSPIIYVAAWIILFSTPSIVQMYPAIGPQLADYASFYQKGYFQIGFIFLLISELVIFFWPIMNVHREMLRQRLHYQARLDLLAKDIDDNLQLLVERWKSLSPDEIKQRLDTRTAMLQVYQDNREFPVWPFDRLTRLKLTSAQVLPILSVLGVGKPILDLVAGFMTFLQQP